MTAHDCGQWTCCGCESCTATRRAPPLVVNRAICRTCREALSGIEAKAREAPTRADLGMPFIPEGGPKA